MTHHYEARTGNTWKLTKVTKAHKIMSKGKYAYNSLVG